MSALAWLAEALKSEETEPVTSGNQTEKAVLVTEFQDESYIKKGIEGRCNHVNSVTSEKQGSQQISAESGAVPTCSHSKTAPVGTNLQG